METLMLGSVGPNVKLIQSLLNRLSYNPGPVNGDFGLQTRQAVMGFQRDYGLTADGVVDPATCVVMERLIAGYVTYTVRVGDTLCKIAQKFYTTLTAVLTANPDIDADRLEVGQKLTVPYGLDVVYTDIDYTYEILERQIRGLLARYPFLEVGNAGSSVMGKGLYYIRIGSGANIAAYNASHHANEWITTTLLMKFIENFAKAYSKGGRLRGYKTTDIWNQSSIYIVPMVNPDGVNMVTYWPDYPDIAYQQASAINDTGLPLPSVWKANIRGVDLNLNYPSFWDREHELEIGQGVTGPAPRDYGGTFPLSEPESAGMVDFTNRLEPGLVIAYHAQGKVIYYKFEDLQPPESTAIAELFAKASGYAISDNPGEASYAGYKDWFLQDFGRPGFTIEVGQGVNPLPLSQFPFIYDSNEEILLLGGLV
jgi:g-D-glutamyl-meso-diaminopimelate peptidase